jgi:hypothetical protein
MTCRELRLKEQIFLYRAQILKRPQFVTAPQYVVALDIDWPKRTDLKASLDSVISACAKADARALPL